jgi:hypothetical protein
MSRTIRIISDGLQLEAALNDSPTAITIWNKLPMDGRASLWGEEIYFPIPVNIGVEEDAQAEVNVGDIAFWPPGSAFCIFFGRTPASTGSTPVAASEVNAIRHISGDLSSLRSVRAGQTMRLERV